MLDAPRPLRSTLLATLLAAAGVIPSTACDLPQNKTYSDTGSGGVSGGGGGSGEITTWRLLQIADVSGADNSMMPGADIDAVVAFRDGEFLFAGCATASLFDQDDAVYPVNNHDDVEDATLAVREDGASGGFLSLAGGVLVCEFPIDLQTGDVLLIAEIEADGAEGWQALVAESGGSAYTEVGDAVDGFAELALP